MSDTQRLCLKLLTIFRFIFSGDNNDGQSDDIGTIGADIVPDGLFPLMGHFFYQNNMQHFLYSTDLADILQTETDLSD